MGYRSERCYKRINGNYRKGGEDFKYVLHYNEAYFKINLLNSTYSVINNGERAIVGNSDSDNSPYYDKNSLGSCFICSLNHNEKKPEVTVIDVVKYG